MKVHFQAVTVRPGGPKFSPGAMWYMVRDHDGYGDKKNPSTFVGVFIEIDSGANQSTRNIVNRMLSALRSDPGTYGGFPNSDCANDPDNRFFWRLAVITEKVVPHAKTLSDRSCAIPEVN